MIDTVLWLAPIVFISAAAYRTVRFSVLSEDWRPPSSRLTLIGLVSTLLLLARRMMLGSLWGVFGSLFSVASMIYAYRVACRAEANYQAFQERTDG